MSGSTENNEADRYEIEAQNLAVADAIRHYCNYPYSQQFAIMVDGPWGSGKTHLINSLLPKLAQVIPNGSKRKPLYISLHGIASPAEIDERIYQQLHPVLSHRYTRIAGIVFKGLLKTAVKIDLDKQHDSISINSQIPDLNLADIVADAPGRIIIFDDFERSAMSPLNTLAYINHLVEHDDCKAIILVNETELLKSKQQDEHTRTAYRTQKEKTVGRTLRIRANPYAAYSALIAEMKDETAGEFLKMESASVLAIFRDSEAENIRLLRQFIWDFERVWSALTPAQRTHAIGMREIMCLLYAITLEIRSGRIEPDAPLKYGIIQRMRMDNKTADDGIKAAEAMHNRYPTVDFDSTLLSEGTLRDLVLHSTIKTDDIQRQLQGHPYFMDPGDQPTWKTLWNSAKLDFNSLQDALLWFGRDFEQRTFQAPDEIMHVIGLSLWLTQIGQEGWDESTIMDKLKSYIDDVYRGANWDLATVGLSSLDRLSGGSQGLAFYNSGDSRFKDLMTYLSDRSEIARRANYSGVAEYLKTMMATDSEAFLRDVCFTNAGPARFASFSVLSAIPAKDFATLFCAIPYDDQSRVVMALSIRYDQVHGYPELKDEITWLADVYKNISDLTADLPPIARYHINNLTKQYILKHLPKPTNAASV